MSRVPTVRKADIDRVLAAMKAAGLTVGGVVIRPGGEVVITPAPILTADAPPAQPDDLSSWRARKHGRHEA